MPPVARHTLAWSVDQQCYTLSDTTQAVQQFAPHDNAAWLLWLATHTSFAFYSQGGHLNVHQETRKHGRQYWYAYHFVGGRASKRYLGQTTTVTFARLEQVAQELTRLPAPTPPVPPTAAAPPLLQAPPPLGLLATKLAPPRLPTTLVVRARLLEQLDTLDARITVISAPAGSGKTLLLSNWLAHRVRGDAADSAVAFAAAWLSLDPLDDDPSRFWSDVIHALRSCLPTVGTVALGMLQSPERPAFPVILTSLLNDLATSVLLTTLVLILDDYHSITDPAIHESLAFAIDHLPPLLHVVIAARVDPELPLALWRVRGVLAEVRADDLRFTSAEAADFFAHTLGSALADDDVRLLERRTAGWAAGLQLAALVMRTQSDPAAVRAFGGSHRYLLDYVHTEILARQAPSLQGFLLHTAVLTRLNAQVCAALTGESVATNQQHLEALERSNLFIVPLDDARQWYRLHDLFREVLLARLQTTQPEVVPTLHQRAARWYAAQNELDAAIAHALAADDVGYAAELMERAAPTLWLRGEAQSVLDWIEALPDIVLQQHAYFVLEAARHAQHALHAVVKAVYADKQGQIERLLARVEAVLRRPPLSSGTQPTLVTTDVDVLLRRIRLLRAWAEVYVPLSRGDIEQMRVLVAETQALTAHEAIGWKTIALSFDFWLTESLLGQGALLIPTLQAAKHAAIAAADRATARRIMLWLAFAYWRDTQYHLAHAECLEALANIERFGEHTAAAGYFYLLLAGTTHAWNQVDAAWDAVQSELQIAQLWQQADLLISGNLLAVDLLVQRGDVLAAEQTLCQAEMLTQQERFTAHVSWVAVTRASLWLATGNIVSARTWAQQVDLSFDSWHPKRNIELLMWVRVQLAQQRYSAALVVLDRFRTHFDRVGDTITTVYSLALHAAALHGNGQVHDARMVALRLLALAGPGDCICVCLDGGEPLRTLLHSLLHSPDPAMTDAATAFAHKLLAAFGHADGHSEPHGPVALPLVEPLTRREADVLRLLVSGASNQAIAAQLVISIATVKKHVGNIFGKLGVQNRVQAITLAHDFSVLD